MTTNTHTTHPNSAPFYLSAMEDERRWLIDRELIAGRDPSCDLVLDKGQASRQHVKFSPADDGILVEDLQSTNGTLVNGQRINTATLVREGDVVSIGLARFKVGQEVTATPADPDATMVFNPALSVNAEAGIKPSPQTGSATMKPLDENRPGHADEAKAPPSWVLSNQQSIDGTQFIAKEVMQNVMAQSQVELSSSQQQVTEPSLIGTAGAVLGIRFPLQVNDKNQWEIGRSPKSDIMLNHESVSSSHGQIVCEGKRWKLMDLMSANGTFVNGKKCLTGYLSHGDRLRFGSVECQFVLPNASTGKGASSTVVRNKTKLAAIAFVTTLVILAVLWLSVKAYS